MDSGSGESRDAAETDETGMRLIRVFPRRTKATPVDALARFGPPDLLEYGDGADEVHVSVTFTDDKPKAERLADEGAPLALPVKIVRLAYWEERLTVITGRCF